MKKSFTDIFNKRSSFRGALNLAFVQLVLLTIASYGIVGIVTEYFEYKREVEIIQNDFLEIHKKTIKEHVSRFIAKIKSTDEEVNHIIQEETKVHCDLLYKVLENVYEGNRRTMPLRKIEEVCLQIVRSSQMFDGDVNFFVYDKNAFCIEDFNFPENVGKKADKQKDELGNIRYKQAQDIIKTEGSGYVENYWNRRQSRDSLPDKYISYVRTFEPFGWIIGQGYFYNDVLAYQKKKLVEEIADFRFGETGYLFLTTFDGRVLVTGGENTPDNARITVAQTEEWRIFQLQKQKLEKEGSGFIEYDWNKIGYNEKVRKISYVDSHLRWNWIVGSGFYLDEAEKTMLKKEETALWTFVWRTTLHLLLLFLLFILISLYSNVLSRQVTKNLKLFNQLLSPDKHKAIDVKSVRYQEFKELLRKTNTVIEEKSKALEQMEKERTYFARLFNHVPQAIAITSKSLVINKVNRVFVEMFGFSNQEIIGKASSTLTPYSFLEEEERIFSETTSGRSVYIPTSKRLRNDGTTIDVSIYATPVFRHKEYFATYLIYRNISEQIETKLQLHESERLIDVFFDISLDGFLIFKFDRPVDFRNSSNKKKLVEDLLPHIRMVKYNKMIEKLYGFEGRDLTDELLTNVFPNREKFFKKHLYALFENGKKEMVSYHLSNTGLRWLDGKYICYYNEVGQVKGFFGVQHEISNRRKIEKSLKAAKRKAESADRLKTAFLSNMSHEIRTPMNAITGFADLLNDPELTDDERVEFVGEINESSQTLLKLIEDIIDISKIESNQLDIDIKATDLNELLTRKLRRIKIERDKQNKGHIEILLRTPEQNEEFDTDPVRLKQIMANLLSNALKFTDKGRIEFGYTVRTEAGLTKASFFVKDTGIGIAARDQKKIFERFVKLGQANQISSGTGLGLSITQKLIELLGGQLFLSSKPKIGTTFSFVLSNKKKRREEPKVEATPQMLAAEPRDLSDKTILIAEDNQINLKLIEKLLSRCKANTVHAGNGKEVLDILLTKQKVDLILMDIQMPIMDGIEATQIIRSRSIEIPIIAQTAFTLDSEAENALQAGCNTIVNKPIKPQELFGAINKYLPE